MIHYAYCCYRTHIHHRRQSGKLRYIADACDDLLLIAPVRWMEKDFGERRFEKSDAIRSLQAPIYQSGRARRYFYHHDLITAALRRFRPDIIHVEAEAGSLSALQAAWLSGRLRTFLTQFCWENIPANPSLIKNLMWLNFQKADYIFCGSRDALKTVKIDGYRGDVGVAAQVGVDPFLESAAEAIRPFPIETFTVGFVGRLDEKKGVFDLIEALRLPRCSSMKCCVVGDGPARQSMEALVAEAGMKKRVRFIGAVPHNRVAAHIRGMDALVLPSRTTPGWKEQFGHVLALAMICGVPAIGANSGAIPEVIGDAGLIVDEGDAAGLADAFAALAADPKKRKTLAAAGEKRAKQNFTDEAIGKKMLAVWENLLSRQSETA